MKIDYLQFNPKISLHYVYSVLFDASENKTAVCVQCQCLIIYATSVGPYACRTSHTHQTDDIPSKNGMRYLRLRIGILSDLWGIGWEQSDLDP